MQKKLIADVQNTHPGAPGQTRAESAGGGPFDHAGRELCPNHLSANGTTICVKTILGDFKRALTQLGQP